MWLQATALNTPTCEARPYGVPVAAVDGPLHTRIYTQLHTNTPACIHNYIPHTCTCIHNYMPQTSIHVWRCMEVCNHTFIPQCKHAHQLPCVHVCIHTFIPQCKHAHQLPCVHVCIYTFIPQCKHAHQLPCVHIHIPTLCLAGKLHTHAHTKLHHSLLATIKDLSLRICQYHPFHLLLSFLSSTAPALKLLSAVPHCI